MLAEEIIEKLEVVELEKLKIHEQVLEPNLFALRETMLNIGKLIDPLIIDKEHKIVLDGNHRRKVLEELKVSYAVCQPIDYYDPKIKIGGWYIATKKIDFEKIRGEKIEYEEGLKKLGEYEAFLMAMIKENNSIKCKILESKQQNFDGVIKEQKEFFEKFAGFDLINNGNGEELIFIEDIRKDIFLERGDVVFARKIFSKKEIVDHILEGKIFPPKSTRHEIPGRIVRLNFRLGYLNESKESIEMHLKEMIKKRVKYGSARYYSEPVIVLY
ncbi:MAG: hypothetical protein N3D10_00985 [Candidatus Micrarchaeota archaeon]|nr:hypothetical protein [Candidatus Micrarchaeota archaeon]